MRISDWSSDVCSSDLEGSVGKGQDLRRNRRCGGQGTVCACLRGPGSSGGWLAIRDRTVTARRVVHLYWRDHRHAQRRSLAPHRHARSAARCARSEEHTSELQSLMRISYAVFCLTKKKNTN